MSQMTCEPVLPCAKGPFGGRDPGITSDAAPKTPSGNFVHGCYTSSGIFRRLPRRSRCTSETPPRGSFLDFLQGCWWGDGSDWKAQAQGVASSVVSNTSSWDTLVMDKKAPNVSPVISRTTAPRMVPGRAHGIAMELLRQFLPGLLEVQGPRVMPSARKVSGEDAVGNRGQIPRGMFGESLVDPGEIPHDF